MASEMLQRDDLSVYVVSGVPKSFKKKLRKLVEKDSKAEGGVMLVDDEMTDWTVARLRGDKRRSHEQTPASSALWRAYRALSAARYHLQHHELELRIRKVRLEVEELWAETSPLYAEPEVGDAGEGETEDAA